MRDSTRPLRGLYIYLTEGCNLRCVHCYLAPRYDPTASKTALFPVEHLRSLVTEGRELGLISVKLTGGEPFLHPRIDEALSVLAEEQVAVGVETNGILCTPERAALLAACRRAHVSVSIDSPQYKIHDAIRGLDGAFDQAVQGIRNLLDAGLKVQLILSLMDKNVDQVRAMVAFAESLGVDSLKFNVVQPTSRGRAMKKSGAALSVQQILSLGEQVEKEIAPTTKLRLVFHTPLAFHSLGQIFDEDTGCGICDVLGILGVLPGGQFALCGVGQVAAGMHSGRVGQDSLASVWRDHPVLQEIRDGMPDRLEGICSRCLMRGMCKGACVGNTYATTGKLWKPYWFCEEAERLGLFPESRLAPPANDALCDGRKEVIPCPTQYLGSMTSSAIPANAVGDSA